MLASGGLALILGLLTFGAYFLLGAVGNFVVLLMALVVVLSVSGAGMWIAKQITDPIEKVTLSAKSLERGSFTSIAKESGTSETDDLLATLSRLGQQTQKVLSQIDEIANGNIKGFQKPTSTSDRLGNSFYNLVTKISNSIKAEKDFNNIRNSLRTLQEDFSSIKRGDLSSNFRQTADETENIAFALNYLLKELKDVVKDVQNVTSQTHTSALNIQESVHTVAQITDSKAKEIVVISDSLKHIPDALQRIETEISTSNTSTILSLENAYSSLQAAQESSVSANRLRQQIQESVGRIQKLNERSQDIDKTAKLVEDLAHRTNMVAMNASVQATAFGEAGRGFIVVAEEIEKLAQRASNTNKQISSLNKSIMAEISELSTSLDNSSRDIASISRYTQQIGTNLTEIEKHLSSNTERQEKLLGYTQLQSQTSLKSFASFKEAILEVQNGVKDLHETEEKASQIVSAMNSLTMAVTAYRLAQNDSESILNPVKIQDFDNLPQSFETENNQIENDKLNKPLEAKIPQFEDYQFDSQVIEL
jgi:methyl-accepting chemotaxis protein